MTIKDDYSWPIDFPVTVPPDDVVPASGEAFRLVDNIPPSENDFRAYRDEKPQAVFNQADLICKSYGVSFWASVAKLKRALKNYPNEDQFGNKKLVRGNLQPQLGVIPSQIGKRGHITLWKCANSQPHLFINIEVQS